MIMPAVTSWYPQDQKSSSSRPVFWRRHLPVPDVAEQAAISMGVPVRPVEYVALASLILASDKACNGKSSSLAEPP